jgi:hypothetical protein
MSWLITTLGNLNAGSSSLLLATWAESEPFDKGNKQRSRMGSLGRYRCFTRHLTSHIRILSQGLLRDEGYCVSSWSSEREDLDLSCHQKDSAVLDCNCLIRQCQSLSSRHLAAEVKFQTYKLPWPRPMQCEYDAPRANLCAIRQVHTCHRSRRRSLQCSATAR